MSTTSCQPIFELTRGQVVESVHFGSIAVVNAQGLLVAGHGDPSVVTFMRSSAKPLQVLPFLELGGQEAYGLNLKEIALLCASHSATDEHIAVVRQLQAKMNIREDELMCGEHPPIHKPSAETLRKQGLLPTPNHHNCSGKHTGMVAFVRLKSKDQPSSASHLPYVHIDHPIQKDILEAVAEMSGLHADQIQLGIDGCSAPNFALPLSRAAFAFARLCAPKTGGVLPQSRAAACKTAVLAMTAHPNIIAGPERFDTRLMEVTHGRMIAKSGAEGYQAIGLLADAIEPGSPALGITIKIADGDSRGIVRPAVALEVLRQLHALSEAELTALAEYGPTKPVKNWRNIEVGSAQPTFMLYQLQTVADGFTSKGV